MISRVRVAVDNVELLVPTGPRVLWRFAAAAGVRRHLAVFAQRELKRQGHGRIGTGRKTLKTNPAKYLADSSAENEQEDILFSAQIKEILLLKFADRIGISFLNISSSRLYLLAAATFSVNQPRAQQTPEQPHEDG